MQKRNRNKNKIKRSHNGFVMNDPLSDTSRVEHVWLQSLYRFQLFLFPIAEKVFGGGFGRNGSSRTVGSKLIVKSAGKRG